MPARSKSNAGMPSMAPPDEQSGSAVATDGGTETSSPQRSAPTSSAALAEAGLQASPTLMPPQGDAATSTIGVSGVGAAVWQSNKTVSGTWSINQTRNGWILVDGVGWRKIFDGSDGAFIALLTLATQARQTGKPITFREESGVIREIYLW